MRVLVMGGTRFLGKALVDELLAANFDVTVLNRGNHQTKYEKYVEHIILDRRDLHKMQHELKGRHWDVVFDLICNTTDEAKIFSEAFKDKVSQVVLLSSQYVYPYGQNLHEEQFDALSYQVNETNTNSAVSETRKVIEAIYAKQLAFKTLSVRVPLIFGEGDPTHKLDKLIQKTLVKEHLYMPNPQARLSVVNVHDLAKALTKLGVYQGAGAVNCASPVAISVLQIVKYIEEAIGTSVRITDVEKSNYLSVFSVKNDWFMDTNKTKFYEIQFRPTALWVPHLIKSIATPMIPKAI